MMKGAVKYKGWLLAKGSKAKELYDEGKLELLDKHLKQLELDEQKRLK
jgi:nitric oxide synthase oxygenase domain/subunit